MLSNTGEYRIKTAKNTRTAHGKIEIFRFNQRSTTGSSEAVIEVEVEFENVKIIEIDDVIQEFRAQVQLSVCYKQPIGYTKDKPWDPQIYFPNCSKIHSKQDELDVEEATCSVSRGIVFDGSFIEILELADFPFDLQCLSIEVSTKRPESEVKLKSKINQSVVDYDSVFKAAQGWSLDEVSYLEKLDAKIKEKERELKRTNSKKEKISSSKVDIEKQSKESTSSIFQRNVKYKLTLYARRRWNFYFWNVILITFLIMGLTFTSGTLDSADTGDRLAVTLTLLLTSVAFKSSITNQLPVIAYLTFLDKYVLWCIFTQVMIAIQNVISSIFRKDRIKYMASAYDLWSMLGIMVVTLTWNCWFLVKAFNLVYRNKQKLKEVRKLKDKQMMELDDTPRQPPSRVTFNTDTARQPGTSATLNYDATEYSADSDPPDIVVTDVDGPAYYQEL